MRKERAGRSSALRAKYIAVAVTAAFAPWSAYGQTPPPPNQMPNVTVTRGDAVVNAATGTYQQIDQASLRAIYEGSMTMGSNAHLHLNHSLYGGAGIGLFKDISGSLSQIFGRITSNGQVFISNPNGVLFGSTARVDVGGLLATTLSTNDDQFMAGGSRIQWTNNGATGAVTNQGEIITASGYAALAGPQVRNDGLIVARTGSVVLAAGDRISLDLIGDGLISVSVDQAALNASVINTGTIEAEGGRVVLTARSANALLDTVINAGGTIRATSLLERNGEIVLDGGNAGTTLVAGTLQAGSVSVNGATINESTGASITADTLTTSSLGSTTLNQLNQLERYSGSTLGGSLTLVDGGTLLLDGVATANGVIGLTTDSITNAGLVTNGGGASNANVVLNADAFNLAGGTIEGGAGAVILRPRTGTNSFGIESAGTTTVTNADIASIHTSDFVVFGSGTGTVFTGNMTIGQNAQVDGGSKNLAFFRSGSPGGTTTIGANGASTTGNMIVSAGGGAIVSTGGTLTADQMQLRASQGIGSAASRVRTNANALAINNTGGPGAFVSQSGGVTLRNVNLTVGGIANNVSNSVVGVLDFDAAGAVNVAGTVTSGPMTLTAAGALTFDTSTQDALLSSSGGQTISAQSVNLIAQNGRRANIENTNGKQKVSATAGDMNLQAPGGGGVAQIVNTSSDDQTIEVAAQLNVLGGATGPSTNSGIFKNGPLGMQTVRAAGITLQGASSGTNAGAGIRSQGDQVVDVSGDINLRGGNGGNLNNAFISASATGQQTVFARDINMSNGVGGIDTSATITAGHQLIDITGNLTMTSQAALLGTAAGGPGVRIGAPGGSTIGTDLRLLVDGNITLNGGTAVENGAAIGSSGAGTPAQNTLHIEAGGNVVLNAGTLNNTGVRIGSGSGGTAGGNISIEAGGSIELNGSARSAAIRTLGNVTLDAASVNEGTNGFILADTLTVTTTGTANLAGPNDIVRFNATTGGPLTLVDAGSLQVTGITTTNDAITLTTDSLTNSGVISNGGGASSANIVLNANAFNLAGGSVEGGAAAVILRPRTGTNSFGIESAGATTVSNADIASIHTSDFVVFGSGTGTIFTGSMTIGQNARVEGGGKNLAFFRSSVPGGTTTIGAQGVNTTGNVIVSAGGGAIVSNGGTVSGDQVQLRASQGIGSAAARVQTAANRLALNNTGPQGAFVFEAGDVTLGNVNLTVGGNVNNVANVIGGGGTYDVTAGGSITLSDLVQAGGVTLATPAGSIIELGAGAINANTLSTSSAFDTTLLGDNRVAVFKGSTSNGDLSLANTGALDVQQLQSFGDVTLVNAGTLTASGFMSAIGGAMDVTTTGAGADFIVRSTVSATATMDLDVAGRLKLSANGAQGANVNGNSQTIHAQSVEVTSENGGNATLSNNSGDQRITVTGGSVDVQVLSGAGFAQILNAAPGSTQAIKVIDGDHVNVNARGGNAVIFAGSTQDVSITGSGANAITVGSAGALGDSRIVGSFQQTVTAGDSAKGQNGSITIVGPDANSRLAGIQTNSVTNGTQTVSTAGTLRVTGGRGAQASNFQSGLFHNGSGEQKVNAGRIELEGGTAGSNNGAFISSGGGGNAANAGAQTITVTGDIVMTGGAGGNANITGSATRLQKITANNISMTNSAAGGNNSGAFILGGHQEIHAGGDVTLTARASGGDLPGVRIGGLSANTTTGFPGTSTDLDLFVGGNLTLNGGTAANNGVGIGSSASGTALPNDIYIDAKGSVILNSGTLAGTGARIGSSQATGAASGDIEIHAGGAIELNGVAQSTAIRTLGNVTLEAASISEAANGLIVADTLTTSTTGVTNLAGPNQIQKFNATSGGPLTLVDGGTLQVTGIATTNDTITLTTDSLTNTGVIDNGGSGNIVFNADAFNLAGGTVEGGSAAVILRPRTGTNSFGIESIGQTTLTNADIASIHTSDFVVFGSGTGTTFTGNMFIGQNAQVDGGGKNLAFFRSSTPGGSTTIGSGGVATTGNVIVSAGGGAIVSEGGTVAGDQVQLRASQGIGTAAARVQTAANRLALNNTGPQGAFVFETGDVTLGNINLTVGGIANNVTNTIGGGGAYDVLAAGSIAVSDLIQAGSGALGTSSGSITEVGAGAIVANDLRTFSGQSTLLGGANQVGVFSASASGDVLLNNAGSLNVSSLFGNNVTVNNNGNMTVDGMWSSALGTKVTTTGGDLTVSGSVSSFGLMDLDIDGALRVTGAGVPGGLPTFLNSSGGQDITAHSIQLSTSGGRFAQIVNFGGDQTITATSGGVDLQSTGAGGFALLSNNGANQTINATGGMRLLAQAGGGGQVSNFGTGDQSITVTGGGLGVTGDGGFAAIANVANLGITPGTQTIRVSGGAGIDLQGLNGGGASISQSSPGREQKIVVTDADHIKLDNTGGSAVISANAGTQTVSITGSGANAILLGSAGGHAFAGISNGNTQNVTAGNDGEQGSIIITGSAVNGTSASIVSRTVADGTQTVSTSGLIRVVGGTAPSQTSSAGIFHNGSGEQKVSAARIELEGGASGNNNAAFIIASGGGAPANAGAQTINVSGDIVIAAGAGGNAGIAGSATRLQKISGHNISITNSALGGNNSVGFIQGGHQDIHATGDVTLTARASGGDLPGVRIGGLAANAVTGFAGTSTDLDLFVGGNLVLSGGTAANNGAGIGSSAAGTALPNDIFIQAGGSVILNAGTLAGTGARIGSSQATGAAPGNIEIHAGGAIELNGVAQGTAIRTLGDVTLQAASITEAARGIIEANALTTSTSGDTLLGGLNRVASFTASSDHGNVQLSNTSAVLSLGSMDLPGNLAIVQTGDLTVGGSTSPQATLVAAAGDISMSASGQILVRGSDTTIGASSAVLAGGDLGFSAGDVTLRAGDAALTPVVVRGANGVQMTVGNELKVTAGGLLSPSLLSSGRNIDLTIGHALRIDGNGPFSLARVQTESRDGVISISFPNLIQGGYFVDGREGDTHQGQTGFFTDFKPAKVGRTLLLEYGN